MVARGNRISLGLIARTRSLARILVELGHEGLVTGEPGLEAQITGKLTRRILRGRRRETTMVNRRSKRAGGAGDAR